MLKAPVVIHWITISNVGYPSCTLSKMFLPQPNPATVSSKFFQQGYPPWFPVYPEEEVKGLATKRNGVSNFLREVTAFEVG